MGTYKLMTLFWPAPRDPEIIVTGGFIEFYVTAADQLFSRSIFLYIEVFLLAWKDYFYTLYSYLQTFYFKLSSFSQHLSYPVSYTEWSSMFGLFAVINFLKNLFTPFTNWNLIYFDNGKWDHKQVITLNEVLRGEISFLFTNYQTLVNLAFSGDNTKFKFNTFMLFTWIF